MFSGLDYTSFNIGPLVFFLICAISSVSWLTIAMSVAIKGIAIVPEKNTVFRRLFFTAAFFAAIFFFAVMKYEWLGGTTSYDGLYHSIGFFGSIIIGLYAMTLANINKINSFGVGLIPFCIPIWFLTINAVLVSVISGSTSGSTSGSVNYISYFIGFLYASIQVIYPLAYYFYIKKPGNMQVAIDKRNAKIDKINAKINIAKTDYTPPIYVAPMQTAATPQPQADPLNATQDIANRQ